MCIGLTIPGMVVCIESPRQLIRETLAQAGAPARHDFEYERSNVFMAVEPQQENGHHGNQNGSHFLRYACAEKITL